MSSIDIRKIGITDLDTDCIVNAANSGLAMGSGVCGAIFRAAGARELQTACDKIGGCPTGGAVITPGFALKAKYVIHAVGPIWHDGNHHEPQDLYSCYRESLDRAKENNCHSIGFPLISAGIFGYPKDKAWRKALQSCGDWIKKNPDYDIEIIFAVLDDHILELGQKTMEELGIKAKMDDDGKFVFFWKLCHKNEEFSNWYPSEFVIEGIRYNCVEQYMMAKKAILFGDLDMYQKIMHSDDPGECKELGKQVSNFDSKTWDNCKYEIVFNGNCAKYHQNKELLTRLVATGDAILAEASPYDKVWGIGMDDSDPNAQIPEQWAGQNLLGKILVEIRQKHKADIYRFAEQYLLLYCDPDTGEIDVDGTDFPQKCHALGFEMDCGKSFIHKYSQEAFSDPSELEKVIDNVTDTMLLGSAVFSKWREITHWMQEGLTSQRNRDWFVLALNRLAKLTE